MADAKQLNSILESILSIEDREVRRQRMNEVDPQILVDVAFSVIRVPTIVIIAFRSLFAIGVMPDAVPYR